MVRRIMVFVFISTFILYACTTTPSAAPEVDHSDLSSPTPTEIAGGLPVTPECPDHFNGLTGSLEVQVLVGPAEAVGLEPTAIGEVPFAVISPSAPYILEGTNAINYESVLEEQWGTYSVFFNMDINISGECLVDTSGEQLDLIVKYSGDQLVEIEAEGFQGEYPWSGTDEIAISLPLQNGATTRGEGWQFVLHVD